MRLFYGGILVLLAGCGSSWTCAKEDQVDGECKYENPFETTPHWRDCDGDGWGEGEPECIDGDVQEDDQGCTWVQNGLDCDANDDTSGGRIGMACPLDYETNAVDTNLTYQVVGIAAREYLFWQGQPEHSLQAQEICESWWTNPLRAATGEFNYGEGEDLGGLLSVSPAERTPIQTATREFLENNPNLEAGETWNVWVDVRLQDPLAAEPVWVWGIVGADQEEVVRPEDWCNGEPDPYDIFPLFVDYEPQAETAVQMFESTRLVMRIEKGSSEPPCIAAPNDISVCPEGDCSKFDMICERKAFVTNCQQSGDVFNPECLNILTLSDLTCSG